MKTDLMFDGRKVYLNNEGYPWISLGAAHGRRRVPVHRWVFEKKLGHRLPRYLHVHHIDGNPLNWSEDNLALLTRQDHEILHAKKAITDNGGDAALHSFCQGCRKVMLREEFGEDVSRWNGKCAYCKPCHAINGKRYRSHSAHKTRAACSASYRKMKTDPEKYAHNLERKRKNNNEYYARHREERMAAMKAKRIEMAAKEGREYRPRKSRLSNS